MTPEPEPKKSRNYHRIGKYDISAHIATGGMGIVYRAVDSGNGQDVALKVLSPILAAKPIALERFQREARRGIKLRHENIVSMYDFGQANDLYYLALEFVDGIDLHDYIGRKRQLEPAEACLFLTQAAQALDYLNKQQLVHRDIKPANFLLTQVAGRPVVKLTDLGLAREIGDTDFRVTRSGNTVGTVDYMSPEQGRDSGQADIRSDIYSLGCTFYHMLAGHPPFPTGGLTERLYKHAEDEPADIRQFNPAISAGLVRILKRMLEKKPAHRYQTPAELLADLDRLDQREFPKPAPTVAPRPLLPRGEDDWLAGATQESLPARPESALVPAPNSRQYRAAAGQFEHAQQVTLVGNYDYAIHLLRSACQLDPANLLYRQTLRHIEKIKHRENKNGKRFAWVKTLAARARLKSAKRSGDYLKVLAFGEDVLATDPWDLSVHLDMAEAAENLGLLTMATWILHQVWQKDTHTTTLDRALARLYEKRQMFHEAAALWRMVIKSDPTDHEAHGKVNDLAAQETISRGHYQELVENRDVENK